MQFKRSGSSEADNNALLRSALGNLRNEVFTVRSDGTHDRAPRSFLMPLLVRHFADRRHAPLLLPQRTEQYCAAHSSAPRPAGALAAIDAAVVALRDPKAERMSTGAWQGELLAALIRACGARRALEIGAYLLTCISFAC